MVNGLDVFRAHFADFRDQYVLIGGAACDLYSSALDFPFRATRDLDIVLCLEAMSASFVRAFWQFVRDGQYQLGQRADGKPQFYRFKKPAVAEFPAMLEIFSRRPGVIAVPEDVQLIPIPVEEEASSLSAILLDDDYAELIQNERTVLDGIPVVTLAALVVLKAKAWMDLRAKRQEGAKIDSKDISKHRNDILRLTPFLSPVPQALAPSVQKDMDAFLAEFFNEKPDLSNLKISFGWDSIKQVLQIVFRRV